MLIFSPTFSSMSTTYKVDKLNLGNEDFYTHQYSDRQAMIVVGIYQGQHIIHGILKQL